MLLTTLYKKRLRKLNYLGTVICFLLSSLLHFSYKLSSGAVWSILFAAANESIWEHIKILTLPYFIWSFIEISLFRIPIKKFIVAKTAGIYSIMFFTIVFFEAYTNLIGKSIVLVDILSAFAWIAVAFFISYKILISSDKVCQWSTIAAFMLILYIVMFMTFTINPPKIFLFLDPVTNTYGIPRISNVYLPF